MLEPLTLTPLGENPLVSILITNYNYSDYLDESINSTLCQNYSYTETILCDDGSTDSSSEVLEEYQKKSDSRLHIIKQSNGGMGAAYNTAYQHSKGEIICFLDADDYYYPAKVSSVVSAFKAHPEAGFLVHRLDKINGSTKRFGKLPLASELPFGWYGEQVVSTGSAPPGFPVTTGLVMRRQVAERIFPVNEEIKYDLDEIIRRLALLTTNVISIEDSLAAYRVHGKNMTSINVFERLKRSVPQYEMIRRETSLYLQSVSPEDVGRFPQKEQDIHYLLIKFVLSKASSDRDAATKYWSMLKKTRAFENWSLFRKMFWNLAASAPKPVFKKLVKMYWHTGGNKLFLSLIQYHLKTLIRRFPIRFKRKKMNPSIFEVRNGE